MDLQTAMSHMAQGAINVSEGHTTIEPESLVHKGMKRVCSFNVVEVFDALKEARDARQMGHHTKADEAINRAMQLIDPK